MVFSWANWTDLSGLAKIEGTFLRRPVIYVVDSCLFLFNFLLISIGVVLVTGGSGEAFVIFVLFYRLTC